MRFFFVVQVVLVLLVVQVGLLGVVFVLKKQIKRFNIPVPTIDFDESHVDVGHGPVDSSDVPESDDDIFSVPKWFQEKVVRDYSEKFKHMRYSAAAAGVPSWAAMPLTQLGPLLTTSPVTAARKRPPTGNADGDALMRLDFQSWEDRETAARRKAHGLPFALRNVSGLAATVRLWSHAYLERQLGASLLFTVERSASPLFTYYSLKGRVDGLGLELLSWSPPQVEVPMSYPAFAAHVAATTHYPRDGEPVPRPAHWLYLTLPAHTGAQTAWVMAGFPFFDEALPLSAGDPMRLIRSSPPPAAVAEKARGSGLRVGADKLFKGVNCRFAQQGVTAAAHYDSHDNWVAIVRGIRRYVLLPPSECVRLHLYPPKHPSARHSALDWANATQVSQHTRFAGARAVEFLLLPGEVLYIPAFWTHYITSLTPSVQCNARFKVAPVAGHASAEGVDRDTLRLLDASLGSYVDIHRCKKANEAP